MEAFLTKDFLAHVQYGRILEHDLCVIAFVFQSLWRLRSSTSPGNPSSYDDLNVVWVLLPISLSEATLAGVCSVLCDVGLFSSYLRRFV